MRTLHVSAGGKNTRIAAYLGQYYGGTPKHLLPIPGTQHNLLTKIASDALGFFGQVKIWVNHNNLGPIKHSVQRPGADVVVDEHCSGPLGPMLRAYGGTSETTYGCAGDLYCSVTWRTLHDFHNSHGYPVTIVISKTIPTSGGAVFETDEFGLIKSWRRVSAVSKDDHINVGMYIIDPSPEILKFTRSMTFHKEDVLNDFLIPRELVVGYRSPILSFNINTAESYKAMCNYL